MKYKLPRLRSNDLLGSPLIEPFKLRFGFDPFPDIQFNSLLYAKQPNARIEMRPASSIQPEREEAP
jgi:hypothetical protein